LSHVVFAAPFFLDTTLRFIEAVADLPGVQTTLVSQDPAEKLPPGLESKLAGHWRVEDGLAPGELAAAIAGLARRHGAVHCLLGTLEQLQVPLAEVRERLGIPGMGIEAALNFRDKARMKSVLQAAGLPCARHARLTDPAQAWEFVQQVGFPAVLKPPAGAGAVATFRVGSDEELRRALAAMPPAPQREVVIEEFVAGEEHSFDTVSIRGRAVWHSLTHYFPTPLQVLENPWIQWCVLLPREVDHPRYDEIRRVATRRISS